MNSGEYIESLIESGDYRTQSEVIHEVTSSPFWEKQAESRLLVSCGIYWQKVWAAVNLCRGKKCVSEKWKLARGLPVKTVKLTPKASQIWRISSITGTTISVKSRLINILIRYPTFFRLWVIIISVPSLNWGIHIRTTRWTVYGLFSADRILKLLLFVY